MHPGCIPVLPACRCRDSSGARDGKATYTHTPGRPGAVRQRGAALEVLLDLERVGAVGTLDLAVEVRVALVDGVHVLRRVELAPPRAALALPLLQLRHLLLATPVRSLNPIVQRGIESM
eukprot:934847-Pyramimonas_sp.AAC.1